MNGSVSLPFITRRKRWSGSNSNSNDSSSSSNVIVEMLKQ